jgi:hypothetical protein
MKIIITAMAAFTAFTGILPAESSGSAGARSITVRLRQIDLDVALKHYEKVRTMLLESQLELKIQGATQADAEPQIVLTKRKIDILELSLRQTRGEIEGLAQQLEEISGPANDLNPRR